MKTQFICFHMPLHAGHSGYSQLVQYLEGKKIDLKDSKSFFRLVPNRLKNKLVSLSKLVWYTRDSLATECSLIINMIIKRRMLFHFIYGENSYRYSGWFLKMKRHKIICTYHIPPSLFLDKVQYTEHIRKLDAIIVVAQSQIDFFSKFILRERIFFVPHGIDNNFFHPSIPFSDRKDNICLFVGHFLRDFKTLREVIHIVHSKNNSIQFVVITRQENFKYFQDEEEVILKTKLDDEELLNYYQNATLLLQPMENCTANNSILEGLACGCPIIATDIGGIRDYVDESCAILVPAYNSEKMAEAVLTLLKDRTHLKQMSENSRKKALEFSWSKVAKKLKEVYRQVID